MNYIQLVALRNMHLEAIERTHAENMANLHADLDTSECYECRADVVADDAHATIDNGSMDDNYHFCSAPCLDTYNGRNGSFYR